MSHNRHLRAVGRLNQEGAGTAAAVEDVAAGDGFLIGSFSACGSFGETGSFDWNIKSKMCIMYMDYNLCI